MANFRRMGYSNISSSALLYGKTLAPLSIEHRWLFLLPVASWSPLHPLLMVPISLKLLILSYLTQPSSEICNLSFLLFDLYFSTIVKFFMVRCWNVAENSFNTETLFFQSWKIWLARWAIIVGNLQISSSKCSHFFSLLCFRNHFLTSIC